MLRIFSLISVLLVVAAIAAFFTVPLGTLDVIDKAHAAVGAIQAQPNDPEAFMDRMKLREFDLAGRERQAAGAAALNHAPAGVMTRVVNLPSSMANGSTVAQQICTQLEKNGFNQQVESQFPLVTRTDSHTFKLQPVTVQGGGNAVQFSFEYTGFIRQGEPRKIADYAETLMRKEVNILCWMAPGFQANPPHVPDVSPTAVVTDLPNEPDTAAAQAKMFKTTPPGLASPPPQSITQPPISVPSIPTPNVSPASATPALPTAPPAISRPVVTTAPAVPPSPAGSNLLIKKQPDLPPNGVVMNGMNYQTIDEVKSPDTDKLLSQGQPDGAAKNGSPLDQPAAQRIKVQQEQEHPQ